MSHILPIRRAAVAFLVVCFHSIGQPSQLGEAVEFAVMGDGDASGADGMSIDQAGNVYCAGATDIRILSPDGKLLDQSFCPTQPINCTLGDQDLRSLYITGFGGVYKQRMKVSGPAPAPTTKA